MCHEVRIDRGERDKRDMATYDLAGALLAIMPNGVVMHELCRECPSPALEACLCQLDLYQTGEANGYEVEEDYMGRYVFTPKDIP